MFFKNIVVPLFRFLPAILYILDKDYNQTIVLLLMNPYLVKSSRIDFSEGTKTYQKL